MFGDFALSCDGPPGTSAEKNKNTHKEQSPLSVHHSPCLRISATAHYVLNVPFPPLQIPTGRSTHPECTMQVLYFGVYDQVRLALARPSKVRFHPDIVRSTRDGMAESSITSGSSQDNMTQAEKDGGKSSVLAEKPHAHPSGVECRWCGSNSNARPSGRGPQIEAVTSGDSGRFDQHRKGAGPCPVWIVYLDPPFDGEMGQTDSSCFGDRLAFIYCLPIRI